MEIQTLFLSQKDAESLLLSDLYFSPLQNLKSYLATSLPFSQPFKIAVTTKKLVELSFLVPLAYGSEGLLIYAKNAVKYPDLSTRH